MNGAQPIRDSRAQARATTDTLFQTAQPTPTIQPNQPDKPLTVLVVEDNPTNRKLLLAQLESENITAHEAQDGLQALEMLERISVDAVISDILMPRMDGYRLCYEVRKRPRTGSLPFIVYSSTYTAAGDESLARSLGADGFIRKPASANAISVALRELIHGRQRRASASAKGIGELSQLKEYSERLVVKLEEKNLELEQLNELFNELLANSPAVIYKLRIEGEKVAFAFVSANIGRLLGVDSVEATTFDWWLSSLHPDDRD